MEATRIGLDVSKNLFELHGVDQDGAVVLRMSVRRGQLQETFARLPRCVVGLEAFGTAHRWGEQLAGLGHDVRLMAPHAVAPYRDPFGDDPSVARAICEALGGENTRYIRVKASRPSGLGLTAVPSRLLAGFGLSGLRARVTANRRSEA